MHIEIAAPDSLAPPPPLTALQRAHDTARRNYFQHEQPGALTEAETLAWELEHFALQLVMEAALIRLKAETEMATLLHDESRAWRGWGIGWSL